MVLEKLWQFDFVLQKYLEHLFVFNTHEYIFLLTSNFVIYYLLRSHLTY